MLYLPAQQSAVEMAPSQGRKNASVTQENNEISEGKIFNRETGDDPGEQTQWNDKDTAVCWKSRVVWIQDQYGAVTEDDLLKYVTGRQPAVPQEQVWRRAIFKVSCNTFRIKISYQWKMSSPTFYVTAALLLAVLNRCHAGSFRCSSWRFWKRRKNDWHKSR